MRVVPSEPLPEDILVLLFVQVTLVCTFDVFTTVFFILLCPVID